MAAMVTMIDPDAYWTMYRKLFQLMSDKTLIGWAVMFGLGFLAAWAIFSIRLNMSADKKNECTKK